MLLIQPNHSSIVNHKVNFQLKERKKVRALTKRKGQDLAHATLGKSPAVMKPAQEKIEKIIGY